MRVLFVTYCFGENNGQTLIGVYKRGLRIALELEARGHEVLVDCTGRGTYSDALTAEAERRVRFVDLHRELIVDGRADGGGDASHGAPRRALDALARCRPDLVVVGEAPLAGTLLESTLCAVELGIPVALLDNAYNPQAVEQFLDDHGGMVDGLVLTGPACAHTAAPPPHVAQVSPFVDADAAAARELVHGLGLRPERLVCVLAYDGKAERLGFSLLEHADAPDADFLFVSRRPEESRRRAAALPPHLERRVRVVELPGDPLLFGLLAVARLAVVKYGFMQVTESTALGTPVICAYHEGPTWVELLPETCRRFVHVAWDDRADADTVGAARAFLDLAPDALDDVHAGGFDAAARSADFLERLPRAPRRDGSAEAIARFGEQDIRAAVGALTGARAPRLEEVRTMQLRRRPGEELYALACRYADADTDRSGFARLWARRYSSRLKALTAHARRKGLVASARRRVLFEPDGGHAKLPPI